MRTDRQSRDSIFPRIGSLALILLTVVALAWIAGCTRTESATLGKLPGPVFREPPTDWPATMPDVERPMLDVEAAWRSHSQPDRAWAWIVVHHSGGAGGDAVKFDQFHRETRGWDELGYDFVIGNGTDTGDGQVQVGSRWLKQKQGAHCATPSRQFNEHGVGVCMVGNFEKDGKQPSRRQWASLVALCSFLCREYDIPVERIIGHRDGQAAEGPVTTECPGRNVNLIELRRQVRWAIANRWPDLWPPLEVPAGAATSRPAGLPSD
jgi:hypothetical protein